jgi:hypothetical protein
MSTPRREGRPQAGGKGGKASLLGKLKVMGGAMDKGEALARIFFFFCGTGA